MTKLTKSERDHLTLLHTAARDPMSTARERATAQAQLADQLVWTGRTDPMNGDLPRLLADLDAAEAERDAHKELIDAARYDVGERSFLEDAQNILKECVAAYSCEQMQAVAKALRQWRDKWAILLETVVRTCEDRDDMMAQRDRAEAERDEWKEAAKTHLAGKVDAWSQRDRAESELDAERKMRVEAEAALDERDCDVHARIRAGYDTTVADLWRAKVADVEAERDALKEKLDANDNEWVDQIAAALQLATDKTGRTPSMMAGRVQRERDELEATKAKLAAVEDERDKALADVAKYADRSESLASSIDHLVSNTADSTDLAMIAKERDDFRDGMVAMLVAAGAPADLDGMEEAVSKAGDKPSDFVKQRIRVLTEERNELWTAHRDVVDERDALNAKLADPRRVVIHETEVVATKEEIASLKTRLADLSEADEELHTCRALVNATSENLSVDLERMVDDLAEANEKAARSEKDSHSWRDLYKDTKAKLAALVKLAESACFQGLTDDLPVTRLIPSESLRGSLINLRAAIAAARGGAQ